MVSKIAWKNIWRSPLRSCVVIIAVFFGVWAFIFSTSFILAIIKGYVDSAVRFQTSHFQIHQEKFIEDGEEEYMLYPNIEKDIKNITGIKAFAGRTVIKGMIQSSRAVSGIVICGVNPEKEQKLNAFEESIIDGNYFQNGKKNQILISHKMAEKLKIKVRKKIVLQFRDVHDELIAGSFRVAGIFRTENAVTDATKVFVNQKDINKLYGKENVIHEVAIKLDNIQEIEGLQKEIQNNIKQKGAIVRNYKQIAPDIELYESQIYVSLGILLVIFMLALVFGILNTMMMAVLERTRELGILMAIGMNRNKIFKMITLETILLGLIGAPLGLFFGWQTINYYHKKGIDLSEFGKGAEWFGVKSIIYPDLELKVCILIMIGIFITTVLAAIYPSSKASKLRPVVAIRKI
ncbi:ABC transporter permease [Aquimarina sp. BL5]|uniref:ABC transporter permease n=1 Tax=Aquimarina sp. BL5 TaxID=1714860 RepID=UPI000E4E4FFD|nr:FtsX-like permease family protein [Aquimarina sp. BL5]AXT51931.1 ABC transporter permease [Aquimarina sp. BL5]RKM93419.1 FtsX-like permease family protein [Aquimarina sp. BL5]